MQEILSAFKFFIPAAVLSIVFTPIVSKIGLAIKAYAVENQRTVHHGKIVRIGGLAIFASFFVTMAIFMKADSTINAILVGGFIVFMGGLIDDIYDLKPVIKFGIQLIGAFYVVLVGGIRLTEINLPFIHVDFKVLSIAISIFWIVGVTNAINLIDGLDGLSCGISSIVLAVVGLIAYFMGRIDVATISIILMGSVLGFLPYNFHPARLFVGDSGALFMGYMIACLSLMGFKTSTFISLGFPIIILFVPLADTSLAIIRRKVSGHKISEADRSHLHHVLMFKLGLPHTIVVLILYLVTLLFGACAILTFFYETAGIIVLLVLCFLAWIFIELSGMINPNFHPLIDLCRKITGHPKKSDNARFEANKITHKEQN